MPVGELHAVDVVVEQRELGASSTSRRLLLLFAARVQQHLLRPAGSSQERRRSHTRSPRERCARDTCEKHGQYLEQLGRVRAHEGEPGVVSDAKASRRCSESVRCSLAALFTGAAGRAPTGRS